VYRRDAHSDPDHIARNAHGRAASVLRRYRSRPLRYLRRVMRPPPSRVRTCRGKYGFSFSNACSDRFAEGGDLAVPNTDKIGNAPSTSF